MSGMRHGRIGSISAMALLTAWAFIVLTNTAHAQAFPSKPIRVVSTAAAGSPPDIVQRALATALTRELGQPIVADNRPGASGIVGGQAVLGAESDGHTLLLTATSAQTLSPLVVEKFPYVPDRDFAPVIHLGEITGVVVAHTSVAANSWPALLALAKKAPGTVSLATAGATSAPALYRGWLAKTNGIDFFEVPYKTFVQGLNALIAGEVNVAVFGATSAVPLAKAGKLRMLAVAGKSRSRYVPDLPSLGEMGIDAHFTTAFALFVPMATPSVVVRRLNSAFANALRDRDVAEKALTPHGFELHEPAGGPPEALARYLEQERAMYARVIPVIGIKPQ